MEQVNFSSAKEEIEYWKQLALEYKESLADVKAELDEFQVSSRELEAELEMQLEQIESRNSDLTAANSRLQMEVDAVREKLEIVQATNSNQVTALENELVQVKAHRDKLLKYVREIEQANDDLERAKRATVVSLEDFEHRLNQAIERNAFLESELDEKENLVVTVQRLKDEARDLRQELGVRKHVETIPKTASTANVIDQDVTDSTNPVATEPEGISSKATEDTSSRSFVTPNKSTVSGYAGPSLQPITPSARISALNIVGDLLRKVGALESKLTNCKTLSQAAQQPPVLPPASRSNVENRSPPNSPSSKRVHRDTQQPSSTLPLTTMPRGYVQITV